MDTTTTDRVENREHAALSERCQEATAVLTAAEQAVKIAQAEYQAVVGAHVDVDDVESHIGAISAAEEAVSGAQARLGLARNRVTALGDAVHPARIAARHAHIHHLRAQEQAIKDAQHKLRDKQTEHMNAIRALEQQLGEGDARIHELNKQMHQQQPRARHHLTVSVRTADAYRPPAGVLVKASAWRLFIERARQEQLDHVHIAVNEVTGQITTGAFPEEIRS